MIMSTVSTLSLASVLIVVLCIAGFTDASRTKRGLNALRMAINTYTARSALDYNNYGCYCGAGGGGRIMDAVDRCCYAHDRCYESVYNSCRRSAQFIFTRIYCSHGSCTCEDRRGTCAFKACTCDVLFGQCLRGKPYNRANKGNCPDD
ncbi:acidic phospholipase A2 E-like [Biomphalaria glabrata]|uniref:Phospholipase A2 n=1 Tax=Biomphalaria glabrata TaxID=6526 RepID=A0A9U8EM64_BIOGL|nr:acidic phospholipase A2 E-like [Biomphalaria glabrata]